MHTDKNNNNQLINWKSVFEPVTSRFSAIELDSGTNNVANVLRIESITTIRQDPIAMLLRPKYVSKKKTLQQNVEINLNFRCYLSGCVNDSFTCLAGIFSYFETSKAS